MDETFVMLKITAPFEVFSKEADRIDLRLPLKATSTEAEKEEHLYAIPPDRTYSNSFHFFLFANLNRECEL